VPRGGSAVATSPSVEPVDNPQPIDPLRLYQLQQNVAYATRSSWLRRALIARGLTAGLTEGEDASLSKKKKVVIDWECALATPEHPKSCLYSFDAEVNTKVVAPATQSENNQDYSWITLTALNRLRRADPSKVEPLWHNQYHILSTWFHPTHFYSWYRAGSTVKADRTWYNTTAPLIILSLLLDTPVALSVGLGAVTLAALVFLLPVWEYIVTALLNSSFLWRTWIHWSRFVHAALPLQIFLVQLLYGLVATVAGSWYRTVRTQLIELECQLLEKSLPLTILE
jgi:hypothetical protein